ncbi:MAG TPA: DUF5615 family PIN-like protein [Gemmataceae bacterium]|nr:DUF5615 family PIN-like protein [Gemmataceae bacterium]
MNLYLDDDSAGRRLAGILGKAGHTVVIPAQVGTAGSSDPRHLLYAIDHSLVLITHNHEDFMDLHDLVVRSGGSHPGILSVRRDNDPRRDMKPRDVVRALGRLQAASVPLSNQAYVLNHWR